MNLLLVSAYFEAHRGGIERVAGRMAAEFARRGVTVRWVAANASMAPPDSANLQVVPVSAWNGLQRWIGLPVPIWGRGALARMRQALRASDVVLIHDALYFGNIVTFYAARRMKKPVILVQHVAPIAYSNPILRLLMRTADRLIGRRMLARADRVVFISEAVRARFAGVPFRAPPQVVFNGVDTALFSPVGKKRDIAAIRKEINLPEDAFICLFSGRFVERKGLLVIRALAAARPDMQFFLAGWGPMDPAAWNLPNVTHRAVDERAAMRDLYRACDLLLLPSVGEGFPLVIQEALACGMPVMCATETIAADEALADMVHHVGVNLINPQDTARTWLDGLDAAARHARAQKPADRKKRAEFAAERYSWERAIGRYQALMDEVWNVG